MKLFGYELWKIKEEKPAKVVYAKAGTNLWSIDDQELITRLYVNGVSVPHIAKKINRTQASVRQRLYEIGVKRKLTNNKRVTVSEGRAGVKKSVGKKQTPTTTKRTYPKADELQIKNVLQWYGLGMEVKWIAKKYGVDTTRIYNLVHTHGTNDTFRQRRESKEQLRKTKGTTVIVG